MLIGIETGGTKVVLATAHHPLDPRDVCTLPTTSPRETLDAIVGYVCEQRAAGPIDAVGIATFGPVDLDPSAPRFGTLGTTPKPGWSGTDLVGPIRAAAGCPVALETDVTAAAVAESRWGAGVGIDDLSYVTVGTGIGLGALVAGHALHGTTHPEAGHISVAAHPDETFAGVCRLHGGCLEGYASGPAITARWGRPTHELGDLTEPAVRLESHYLSQLAATLVYVLSPGRLVLGGGVLHLPGLRQQVREHTARLLAGARPEHPASNPESTFIAAPHLGDRAGVIGALTLAADQAQRIGDGGT